MELSQLPQEMVVVIADLLEARDVTACSGVSISWRRAFNLDHIWRNFCSFNPSYFEEYDNQMMPSFEIPHVDDSNLEPLCQWRVSFLKDMYMMRNWRKGCFSSAEVEVRTSACLYMMDAVDKSQNHWLFMCCAGKEGLRLEVWNIKNIPFLHKRIKMCTILKNIQEIIQNNLNNFKLHLSGEKLLFIYDNMVTACDFSSPKYTLSFLYNFSFIHIAPSFSPRRIPHVPEGSLCAVEVMNDKLFGVFYSSKDRTQQFSPSVHVWDINIVKKIKGHCVYEQKSEDFFPFVNSLALTSGESQNLVITRTFDSATITSSRIRTFNTAKCEYNRFFVHLKFPVIWTAVAGDVVVACEHINPLERDCVFYFYSAVSALCFAKTHPYNIYDPENISSSDSKFAFIDLNGKIIVYDIFTHQSFTSSLQPTRNRFKTVTMVNDQLLLLESKYRAMNRSFENILVTSYEIWDFERTAKPLRMEQCFYSTSRTKFTFLKNCKVPSKLLTVVQPLYRPLTICINSFW